MNVAIRSLVVGYRDRPVARLGDLVLTAERVTLVVGPNGSGKTTFLKTLAGLLRPLEGTVASSLPRGRHGAVFVHSSGFLFHGTVRKNLMLAAAGGEAAARQAAVALGVEALWGRAVAELSTGQRQRVALARAMAAAPELLLVDEPEGGLDAEAIALWGDVLTTAVEAGRPLVVVAAHRPAGLGGVPLFSVALRRADGESAPFVGVPFEDRSAAGVGEA